MIYPNSLTPDIIARRADAGIKILRYVEPIDLLLLDHDLGKVENIDYKDGFGNYLQNDGHSVLKWLELEYHHKMDYRPKSIIVVSANPPAVKKMNAALEAMDYTPFSSVIGCIEWMRLPE